MKKTIKKVLVELDKDTPRLDYIRGLLEGLVEEDEVIFASGSSVLPSLPRNPATMDEGTLMDATAKANLSTVKKLSEQGNG